MNDFKNGLHMKELSRAALAIRFSLIKKSGDFKSCLASYIECFERYFMLYQDFYLRFYNHFFSIQDKAINSITCLGNFDFAMEDFKNILKDVYLEYFSYFSIFTSSLFEVLNSDFYRSQCEEFELKDLEAGCKNLYGMSLNLKGSFESLFASNLHLQNLAKDGRNSAFKN